MNIFKQLAGQTIVYGMGTMIPRVLNYLLLTPFYSRLFLPQEYAVITEIYAYVAFLLVLLTYGMETTYFRFASNNLEKQSVFNIGFTSLLITSSIFVLLIALNLKFVANSIGYQNHENYVLWFSLIVALDAITALPFAKLRLENKARLFALIKIGNISVNILFNVFFFMICKDSKIEFLANIYNHEIGVGYAFISNLLASLFNLIFLFPQLAKFKFKINWTIYKSMLKYAFPLLIVGLAGMINEVADKLLIKHLISLDKNPMYQLGIYGANYKLAVLMTIFIQMFKYAAEPFFFNQANRDDAKKIYAQVMNYFIIFCFLIFLFVVLYLDIFKYFIDPNYFEGLFIVPIVLLANMFLGIYYNLSVWYKLTNRTKYGAYIAIVGVILTLFINFNFVKEYGYLASAWGHFVCYFIMMIISFFMGKRFYKVEYNLYKVFIYSLITFSLFILSKIVNLQGYSNILFSTILISVYIVSIFYFEKINISQLKQLIKK